MSKGKKRCPTCDHMELARVSRHGFLQEHVYPHLGVFPWECAQCRNTFLLKNRGRSYRRSGTQDDGALGVYQGASDLQK